MADPKTSVELIKDRCGRWSSDIELGWTAGLQGKYRIRPGGKLLSRPAPDHFYEARNHSRLEDWLLGRTEGENYRATHLSKATHFVGQNAHGEVVIIRKGWVSRGPVVSRMERQGCFGDVRVYYFLDTELKRTVTCGI